MNHDDSCLSLYHNDDGMVSWAKNHSRASYRGCGRCTLSGALRPSCGRSHKLLDDRTRSMGYFSRYLLDERGSTAIGDKVQIGASGAEAVWGGGERVAKGGGPTRPTSIDPSVDG